MVTTTRILCLVGALLTQASWAESQSDHNESFTARDLVAWVWERNPGLAELQAALDVTVERIDPAGSLDDPTLSYAFAPRTFGRDGQGLNQKIEFSQSIPWPGTLAARRASATHKVSAARRDIDVLRLELAAVAQSAYAEWYYLHQSLAIHHRTHQLLTELHLTTEVRYAAGKALQQDVLRAELELRKLDRHFLQLKRVEASLLAQINALLNRDPSTPLPEIVRVNLPTTIPLLAELQTNIIDGHPALMRLESQLASKSADVTVAKKAFFPDLRVTAGYNSLWDEADKRPIVGISINVPLNRTKRRSTLSSAEAAVQRVRWRREEQRAQLLGEVAKAHAAVRESLDAVKLYESSLLPLAREYFLAARADYESGAGSFLSVIAAERQQLNTEDELERNRADLQRRRSELERASGVTIDTSTGGRP